MFDRLKARMASLIPKNDGEASLFIWILGGFMTCLAVVIALLGNNNELSSLSFIITCSLFNLLQFERVKTYGPYVLVFPVISALPWPANSGTPDLACRLPLVGTLTTLLIWNAPTIAAMLRSPQNNRSMGTNTTPAPLSSRAPSRASSMVPYQDVASLARTLLWVNESTQPWTRSVCRTWSSSSGGLRSDSSISLSDGMPPFWTGSFARRYTDPTLVNDGPMLSEYAASLRGHVPGFNMSRHGSIRPMSPVSMER